MNQILEKDPISYCTDTYKYGKDLLNILLADKTTQHNIIWGIDGKEIEQLELENLFDNNVSIIRPRIYKSKKEQEFRIKEKAEVFTPTWICNLQNNVADEDFFGNKNIFNTTAVDNKSWVHTKDKVVFPPNKVWEDYIKQNCLEITCGEAPYLVSPYDTTTGKYIPLKERIGLLDRKLRIVNENTTTEEEWIKWAIIAYKHSYGYEWQGDSLLIARVNLFLTFIKYFEARFNKIPEYSTMFEVANIISWNIVQMDGLSLTVPYSCSDDCKGCKKKDLNLHNGTYAKTYDWDKDKPILWLSLLD